MARISTYALDDTLEQDDKIIGTDTSSANATMNFSLQQLGEFYTRTGLADASTVFTFDVAAEAYGTTIPTTLENGTIYFNFNVAADLSEMIIPIETNSGVATLPFVNAISNEVVIINQAGADRGLHYGFYDVGQTTANRDVEILGTVRGYRIPLTIHASGATTTGLPTGHAVVTPIGIVGTSQDLTTRLLTDLANVSVTDDQAATFRAAIGLANIGQQFADQQALEDFITNKADFRTDLEIDDQFADQTALETFITDDAAFRTAIGAGVPLLVDGTGTANGINNVNELFFSGSNIEISSDQGGGATVTVNHVPIEKDGIGVVDANQVQINTINYTGVGVNITNSAGVLTVDVPGVDSGAVALNTTHRETTTGNPHDVQIDDISNLDINTNTRTVTIGANTITVPGTTDDNGNTVLGTHSVTELDDVTDAGSGIIITALERTAISDNTTNLSEHEADVANPHEVTAAQVGVGLKATSFPDLLANAVDVKEVGTLGVVADAVLYEVSEAIAPPQGVEVSIANIDFSFVATNDAGIYTLAFPQQPAGDPLMVGDRASFFIIPDGGGFTKGLETILVENEVVISQNVNFGGTQDPIAATLALTQAEFEAVRDMTGVSVLTNSQTSEIVGIPTDQIYLFEGTTVPTHTVTSFYVFKTASRPVNTAASLATDWVEGSSSGTSATTTTTGLTQAAADLRYAPITQNAGLITSTNVSINRTGSDTGSIVNGVLTLSLSRHTTGVTPDPLTAISLTAGAVFGLAGINNAPLTPVFTPGPGVSVTSALITGGGISAQGLTAVSGTTINVNQTFTLGQSIVFTLTVIGTNADGEAFTETAMATSTLVTRASTPPVITLGTFTGFTASNANHLERFDSGSINFTATPGQPGDFVYITSNSSPNPLVVGTENSAVQTITSTDRYNPPGIDVTTTRTLTPAISVRYGATSSATINTTMIRNFTDANFLSGFPINPIGTQFSITTTDGQRMWFAYDDNETDVTGVFIHGFDNIGIFTRQQIVETGYAIWVSSPVAAGTFDLILR